jgi:hypothetical protein
MLKISESLFGFEEATSVSAKKIEDIAKRILQEYRRRLTSQAVKEPATRSVIPRRSAKDY